MLSAVAARKAALATQQQPTPPVEPAKPVPKSPSHPPTSSKRKSNTNKLRQDAKKPKRGAVTSKPKSTQSTVDQDLFKSQADVIAMDVSEEEEESDSDMSDILEEYGSVLPPTPKLPPVKRAWSPSQPLMDSSDEEMDAEGDVSLLPRKEEQPEDDTVISTFDPVVGKNVMVLKAEELRSLELSQNTTIVAMNPEETLCLLGTCKVAVLHGSLDVFGTTIPPSATFHALYAPRSNPLPILQAAEPSSSKSPLREATLSPRLRPLLQFQTVIALQESRTGVEGLGRICRTFEGTFDPPRWQKSTMKSPFSLPGLYMVTQHSKELHAYGLPSSWADALNDVTSEDNLLSGTFVIKGPKNSGKSTFARTLMNRLLRKYRRVAFLECDLGQSEFTPGGMVALNIISEITLGPPATHPTLPNFAHFIGSTTPRSCPSLYLDSISALVQTYRLDIQSPLTTDFDEDDPRIQDTIPLIVNTMGWSKGLGADLTAKIESFLEATHVFDIQAPVREEYAGAPGVSLPPPIPVPVAGPDHRGTYGAYYAHGSMDAPTARLFTLEPVTPYSTTAGYTAAEMRTLSILSYFHAQFPLDAQLAPGDLRQITAKNWDTSTPLCAIPPYEIDCALALDKVILTGAGSEDVVEEEIARVLNGAIVGLIVCEPGTLDASEASVPSGTLSTTTSGIPYTQQFAAPSPASSTCVGLALIRAVSPSTPADSPNGTSVPKTYLQLLSPLPHALLAQSRVLVKGEIELPVWGMLDFRNTAGNGGKDAPDPGDVAGVERDKVPFLQWGRAPEGVVGAEKKRVRRNLMRRGQM